MLSAMTLVAENLDVLRLVVPRIPVSVVTMPTRLTTPIAGTQGV